MIHFEKEKMLFHLTTEKTSYIFAFYAGKYPVHLYWGKKLRGPVADIKCFPSVAATVRTMSALNDLENSFSSDSAPMEFSTFGNPDLRIPCFHAKYKNGTVISDFRYVSHEIYRGKRPLDGLPATYVEDDSEATSLDILLRDDLTGVEVTLRYTVFEELNAITRSVLVVNHGDDAFDLTGLLSATVDFDTADLDFIHLEGVWAKERVVERSPLITGMQQIGSLRGMSSSQHNPFFALARKGADEAVGDVYGFNLIYSGNFTAGVETDVYKVSRAFIGINPFNFSFRLKKGDRFQSPEAVLVFSDCGIGGMSRIYHKLYRTRLCRGRFRDAVRPVLINNWEATYMDFDEEKIVSIAERAKDAGVELVVLDDGWFGHRNDDRSSLGDWYVNKDKLPLGLDHLVSRIRGLGMKFGLWFEPEMVSPDSDLYRAHPDWCIHAEGRERTLWRSQLVLDLSREEVCDYIINSLRTVLKSTDISYVKWDCNRNMTNFGSAALSAESQGELCHRYILGLYRILDTVTSEFPDVLFEGCSAGGNRYDGGILYYMPQIWCSDDTDAVERSVIQHGTSMCYPYITMGAHVSAVPNHQVGRTTPITARGITAMQGQLGYELDLGKLSDDDFAEVKKQIAFYKKYGEVFHKGDLYRLYDPNKGVLASNEFVSEDGGTVIVTVMTLKASPNAPVEKILLRGLDGDADYRLEGSDTVYHGDMLMQAGLSYLPTADYQNRIYVFKKD